MSHPDRPQPPFPPRVAILALVVIAFDGLVLGLPALSLGAPVVGLALLVAAIAARDGRARRRRARDAILCLVMLPAVFGVIRGNAELAQSSGDALVMACSAYHARYGSYPERLEALVPEFIDGVPLASIRLTFGTFRYWRVRDEDNALLVYWITPPFLHRTYSFARGTWMTLD